MGFDPVTPPPVGGDGGTVKTLDDAMLGMPADTPDGPLGMGSYTVTDTTMPYTVLATPTTVPGFALLADDEAYPLALPFPFTFYGISYTTMSVSMNGYVTFAGAPTAVESRDNDCPAFDGVPDATIAVFWDDLYASDKAPVGALGYAVTGSAPDRALVIEWRDLDAFYQSGSGNNAFTQGIRVTQSITLHENGVIELHYGPRTPPTSPNQDCGPNRHLGCSATVGLERPGAAMGALVQCGTATMLGAGWKATTEGRLITFTPQ